MYHRACEINEFRSFDLTYLISALVFLPLLFFFSDQRLPNFLYFNSSAYLEKLGRIKQLKASLDMTKYDPRFLDNRREYRSLNSLSIQGINDYILHESDNNQLPTQESNCSNALKDLESYKRLKQQIQAHKPLKNSISGYLKTEVDIKYENSMPLILFLGSKFIAIFALLFGSGTATGSLAQVVDSFSSCCAIHMVSKIILKSLSFHSPEKYTKIKVLGFLNMYDLAGLVIAGTLAGSYLLTSNPWLQNTLMLASTICLLQILQFRKFKHILFSLVTWWIVQYFSMVKLQYTYGYALDTFIVQFSILPFKFMLPRSTDYIFSEVTVTGIFDVLLIGFFLKTLRALDEYTESLHNRGINDYVHWNCLKSVKLANFGFLVLTLAWIAHAVFLTSQIFPINLFVFVMPIFLISVVFFAILSGRGQELISHDSSRAMITHQTNPQAPHVLRRDRVGENSYIDVIHDAFQDPPEFELGNLHR